MSEGIRKQIKDIKIIGKVHNWTSWQAPEEFQDEGALEALIADMATAIKRHTGMDSYIEVRFTKVIGTKVNS